MKALEEQSLSKSDWELILIDNASSTAVSTECVQWHPQGRIIVEKQIGLTHARLTAIRESVGDIIVFVDDDNVLKYDFLETSLSIAESHPHIGAWSGQCHPEFDVPPAPWVHKYLGMLVIKEFSTDCWSNLGHLPDTMPCGAGLCVRRSVAAAYLNLHDSGQRPMLFDRRGTSLMSAGDNDLSACACDIGLGVGLFHKLELTHLINEGRTTEEYLARLAEGIHYSTIHLLALRGKAPLAKSRARRFLEILQAWRKPGRDRRIYAAYCRGENRALRELALNKLPRDK